MRRSSYAGAASRKMRPNGKTDARMSEQNKRKNAVIKPKTFAPAAYCPLASAASATINTEIKYHLVLQNLSTAEEILRNRLCVLCLPIAFCSSNIAVFYNVRKSCIIRIPFKNCRLFKVASKTPAQNKNLLRSESNVTTFEYGNQRQIYNLFMITLRTKFYRMITKERFRFSWACFRKELIDPSEVKQTYRPLYDTIAIPDMPGLVS